MRKTHVKPLDSDNLIQLQPRGHHHRISCGRTVLTTALDGSVQAEAEGLWVYQTRMLSRYRWRIDGATPTFSALSAVEQHRDLAYYIFSPPECRHEGSRCDPAQQAVELRIEREVGEGLRERVTLTNHTQLKTSFELELQIAADFADPAEVRGRQKQKGKLSAVWNPRSPRNLLRFDYRIKHKYRHQGDAGTASLHRGIRLELKHDQQKPKHGHGSIRFRVQLKPRQVWRATLQWVAQLAGADLPFWGEEGDRKRRAFFESSAEYNAPCETNRTSSVLKTLSQAANDFVALRLFDLDHEDRRGQTWMPAAGVPVYLGFFGRDILFSSRQTAVLSTETMRGVLAAQAHHLGDKFDYWRDEQPGRMVHELHTSPLAVLNYNPHGRYFGTVTGSFFYPALVAELWRWTGDKELVRPFLEAAHQGLRWADKYTRDESGFYKYQTRSKQGEKNQGWKDSGDAIVHADGSQVPDPLGTCEMQAYIYGSKVGLAEVLEHLGEKHAARHLKSEAREFKKRFNNFFWMEKEGTLAMGIDAHNRPIRSVSSDAGHCLMNDIVDDAIRGKVAKRLMMEDMFSGWGVRTLSAKHPAYNPFSYHCGSVWPVENAMFVLALAQCGLHAEMNRLALAIFESAELFKFNRLPEVFGGHARDEEHPFPGLYPKANTPQAWSASAPFLVIQAMLGIRPDAANRTLLVDPHLPKWLPELKVAGLKVGGSQVDLRFYREKSGVTSFEVLRQKGKLAVVRRSSS
jgi:glycogen debranching enzyme